MTLRLLHLADLHLDTVVGGRTEAIRARVRAAIHAAFARAVEHALHEEVHAVLLAGDCFDDPLLTRETAALFRAALHRLAAAGVTVVWCTGNHDPGGATVRGRQGRAALLGLDDPARHGRAGLHVFRGHRTGTCEVRDAHGDVIGTVTSIGHRSDADGEDLAARLTRPAGRAPAVALLHTQVEDARGAAEHARYAPCTARTLAAAGFDYWALGHVHVRGPVAGAPAWYAGCLQGRSHKEPGPHGGLLVEVDAGEPPRVTPFDCAPLCFETVRLVGLESLHHAEALNARVAEALATRPGLAGLEVVLRLELAGASPLARRLARPEERAEVERALTLELGLVDCELRLDGLAPVRDLADFHATPSALREAHRLLVAARADDPSAAALADVELSPAAPPTGDPGRAPYLRARLAGLADELLSRALGEVEP